LEENKIKLSKTKTDLGLDEKWLRIESLKSMIDESKKYVDRAIEFQKHDIEQLNKSTELRDKQEKHLARLEQELKEIEK
jgi:hypothetical protein